MVTAWAKLPSSPLSLVTARGPSGVLRKTLGPRVRGDDDEEIVASRIFAILNGNGIDASNVRRNRAAQIGGGGATSEIGRLGRVLVCEHALDRRDDSVRSRLVAQEV